MKMHCCQMKPRLGSIILVALSACWLPACKTTTREPETAPGGSEALGKNALASSYGRIDFFTHVKPVLEAKCVMCHNTRTLPFFSLENRREAFTVGPIGPRIVPRYPEQSALVTNATEAHSRTMPPVGNRFTENERRIIIEWVLQGAEWPEGPAGELRANGRAYP